MNKNVKLGLIGLVVLLLVFGIYFLFKDDAPRQEGESGKSSTAMEFSNIEMKEDQAGKSVWKIKAKHVTMSQDKNTAQLEGLEGTFLKDGDELHLTADTGTLNRKEKTVYIEGHVEGKSSDGMVLHAKNLTYDGKTEKLSTDQAFVAEKDGKILTADSFVGDRVLQQLTAKGHAKLAEKEEQQ